MIVHLCPDELSALAAGLPLVGLLTCYGRRAWRYLASRAARVVRRRDGT
jgi:hypothetical protein